VFEAGDRVEHKVHKVAGHIDRVLPNRNLIIITDTPTTVVAQPWEVDYWYPVSLDDLKFLESMKVRW